MNQKKMLNSIQLQGAFGQENFDTMPVKNVMPKAKKQMK